MRRLFVCLIVSLALAAPAMAREGRTTIVEPSAAGTLRGTMGVAPPPTEAPIQVLPPPVLPTALVVPPADPSRCRVGCSREYYLCLTGEDERCPQYWSRCVSACGS